MEPILPTDTLSAIQLSNDDIFIFNQGPNKISIYRYEGSVLTPIITNMDIDFLMLYLDECINYTNTAVYYYNIYIVINPETEKPKIMFRNASSTGIEFNPNHIFDEMCITQPIENIIGAINESYATLFTIMRHCEKR